MQYPSAASHAQSGKRPQPVLRGVCLRKPMRRVFDEFRIQTYMMMVDMCAVSYYACVCEFILKVLYGASKFT